MKKLLLAAFFLLSTASVFAQLDVKAVASQIIGKLTPALSLTDDQKPQVSDAVTEFLGKKSDLLPLKATDPSAYNSKFNLLNGGLIGKLKTILVAKQMTSFLIMKPKTNDVGNVLSQLFF